uniref:Uncharacterized protein n=1 Tax=Acrobeloides nanus TaxID=290746 RepID=A0A914EGD9_9BILA
MYAILDSFAVPPAKNTNDVLLTDWLLPLLPYFPGGNGPCNFDRVFVGSFQRNDVPAGMPQDWDPYYDGMLSTKYRGNMLARQKAIAQQFNNMVANSTNPNVQWDWYINQENSLDYSLSDPNVTNGELQFIVQQIIDFNSIRKDRVFLWSPWFTYHPSDFPVGSQEYKDLTTNLKKLFTQIPKQVAPYNAYGNNSGGPLWISLQDHVGSESTDPAFNRTGAAQWFNYLKANFSFKNLTMNVELFLDPTDPNASPSPAPCQEIYDREQFYVQQGINLGPTFELRYWDTCNHL